ncbi:MAG: hypothetical protein LAO24_03680 [Acidobacteriia bacterium]|nr:hypothetical protein [Terriglobia bacterium]
MLQINLLTNRRDAEQEYLKMHLGAVIVDHLAMHLDRTVRRRVLQNIRNDKKQPALLVEQAAKRAAKIKSGMGRRAAKYQHKGLGSQAGPAMCEVGKPRPTGRDKVSLLGRCDGYIQRCGAEKRMGKDQVDVNDRPMVSVIPVGLKKPSKATIARIIAERKDYLPRR